MLFTEKEGCVQRDVSFFIYIIETYCLLFREAKKICLYHIVTSKIKQENEILNARIKRLGFDFMILSDCLT